MVIFWNFAGVPFVCRSLIFGHLLLTSALRHTSILWSTWPRMIRQNTSFLHPYMFCFSPRCSPRTTCQHISFLVMFRRTDVIIYISWDTSMSQKSRFKMQTQGIHTFRNTFPQLPWNVIKNPTYIQTAHGYVPTAICAWRILMFLPSRCSNRLLTSGWWAYSRKPASAVF